MIEYYLDIFCLCFKCLKFIHEKKSKSKNCTDSLNIYTNTIEEMWENGLAAMAKVNDIPTFLKGRKGPDAPALVVNEYEIKKNQYKSESIVTKLSQKQSKERLGNMHYFMEPKQQLSDSIRFIQSTLSLELPSITGNSK